MFDSDCVILHTPTNGRASVRLGGGEGWGVARGERQLRLFSAHLGRGGTAQLKQINVSMLIMLSNCCLLTIVEIFTRSPCLLTFIMSQTSKMSQTQKKNKVHLEVRFINDYYCNHYFRRFKKSSETLP